MTYQQNFKNISQEQIDQIISLYKEGKNSTYIGKIFGRSHTYILSIIKKFSIIDRSRSKRIQKFFADETWFDDINSEQKAYFLGLLFSDGNVKKDGKRVSIGLIEQDKEILSKFSNLIYGKDKLNYIIKKEENHNNCYEFCILSQKINKRLTELGCTPNKSLTLQFPEWLTNKELQRHFLRGYFDGDGCLKFYKNQSTWQITSTNDFCKAILEILKEQNINSFIYENKEYLERGNNITKTLQTGGNRQVLRLCNWLYKDATVFFQRKYNKYLELIEICKNIDLSKENEDRHINQYK